MQDAVKVGPITPEEQRAAFASTYSDSAPSGLSPEGRTVQALDGTVVPLGKAEYDVPLGRRRGMSEDHLQYLDELVGEMRRAQEIGIQPATILNLSPLTLKGCGVLTDDIVIPPPEHGRPWRKFVITEPRVSPMERGDGKYSPKLFVPIILAREFEEQYYGRGGVVIYAGNRHPEMDPELVKKIKEATVRMMQYARERYTNANSEWHNSDRTGRRNITPQDKQYAQMLLDAKIITEKPPWQEFDGRVEAEIVEPCPMCKREPKKGAVICDCGYIFDPKAAWENDVITDPNHNAMLRLSRAELDELGISELIEETASERKKRYLAEAAKSAKAKAAKK